MFNENLLFRYATKSFDKNKKVSEENISKLKESIIFAPTSLGLQPFKVVDVRDPITRKKIQEIGRNQPQFVDSSHLFIFIALKEVSQTYIDKYINLVSSTRDLPLSSLEPYKSMIEASVKGKEGIQSWTSQQAHIALGFLMLTAGNLHIDTCAIGGFDNIQADKILNLEGTDYSSVVAISIGYRDESDKYATMKKVRFSEDEMFITI